MARRGGDFGVTIEGPITVDMKRVKARKDAIVKQSNDGVTNWLKGMENLTVYEGHGCLESANSVRVNGEDIERRKTSKGVLCCRTYSGSGVPPKWMIEAGVIRALKPNPTHANIYDLTQYGVLGADCNK